ncbi:MAG: PEGA domain-containing protein [Bacteroidales bacterium]|nr:PEGA domain-containing protein [Bacteroidales bacterium]
MKNLILFSVFVLLGLVTFAQSPLKMVSFHKNPNEIVDLRELKEKAGSDSDLDGNKAARIRIKAQGFDEKKLLDFTVFPRPGMEVIYKEFKQGEMWVYVSSKVQGTLVIKYMGEFEFKLPNKLEPKCGYDLVLGMETGTLVIRTVPTNAEIYIDNEKVGTGYASKAVSVGSEHSYKVQCTNYYPKEGRLFFSQKEEKSLNVELDPNFGYITIKSEPSGAEVYVDDEKVGTTPYLMKKIKLGQHVVELRKTGYESTADMVTIKIGEPNTQLENVKLTAVRVPMGSLDLSSNPTGAIITINGKQYGQTPKTITEFEVGTYTVYFSKEGYENLAQTVTVKDGKQETLAVTMMKTSVAQQPVPTPTPINNTNTTASNAASSKGVFSVSSYKKVQFSQGNLQYQASTRTWRFAEHQWDIIGDANKNISSSYSGWIDLFGWGTSGYNGKNPWMTSTTSTDYGNGERNIAGTNYDWGVNNTISNGGGKSWRTLTRDEWVYVFNTRSTSSGIRYAKATVNGVNGVILLPDNWSSSNYSLGNTNKPDASFSSNRISQSDWTNRLEANGAVFLPAAGYGYGTGVGYVGSWGNYWSASYRDSDSGSAHFVDFSDEYLYPKRWGSRFVGRSVRLVSSAE